VPFGLLYTSRESLTHTATITSSVALSNLLSGPPAPSPKRRFSVSPDGSDDYDGRPRKSPRPDMSSIMTPSHPVPAPPGFAQPSPTAPPGSDQSSRQLAGNAQQTRHAQARMRSSIACARCRRSKVKCVNSGVGTPCRSCEAGNRECTYPVPVTGGRKRENSLTGPAPKIDPMTEEVDNPFFRLLDQNADEISDPETTAAA
jgi:ribosomal protein L37AE/L43A